jgi:hypothetical protein
MRGTPPKRRAARAADRAHDSPLVARREANPLVDLPADVLDLIVRHLNLPSACALRQTCWALSQLRLSRGQAIALQVQKAPPSYAEKWHLHRERPELCLTKTWSVSKFNHVSRAWRREWAGVAQITDAAPTAALIGAFGAMPPFSESRAVLKYRQLLEHAIEDRFWDVCCGKDRYRCAEGHWVAKSLSHEEVTRLVAKMLESVRLWYGSASFYHTEHGRFGYTPFLLAAEQHNLPLVKYLHEWGHAQTVHARTRMGNNAFALCRHRLAKTGHTGEEIEESAVLRYLCHHGVEAVPMLMTIDVDETDPLRWH